MLRNMNGALQLSFSTSLMANVFQIAPESLLKTTPENERSTTQKVAANIADAATYYVADSLMTGHISPASATIALGTLATAKGMALKDSGDKAVEKKDCVKEVIKDVASATTQRVIIAAAKEKLHFNSSPFSSLSSLAGIFASSIIQNARIPGEPQVAPEDLSWKQMVGHGLVNSAVGAGVVLSTMVALSPTVLAVGLIGSGTAIIANTIIGKKRDPHFQSEEVEEKYSHFRR